MIQINGSILFLTKEDLLPNYQNKRYEDITVENFNREHKPIDTSHIIFYEEGDKTRVIKNRYGKTGEIV